MWLTEHSVSIICTQEYYMGHEYVINMCFLFRNELEEISNQGMDVPRQGMSVVF